MMIQPKEAMSQKEVSSKKSENKVSLHNTGKRVIPRNTGKKGILNLQSDGWSSYLNKSLGEDGKNAVIAKQEINDCCLQYTDKLTASAHGGEGVGNDEDGNPKRDTHAPLELMAEFLRAEMGRDYHLAEKLCKMILIYEPENLEAKEFSLLIEEILLKAVYFRGAEYMHSVMQPPPQEVSHLPDWNAALLNATPRSSSSPAIILHCCYELDCSGRICISSTFQ